MKHASAIRHCPSVLNLDYCIRFHIELNIWYKHSKQRRHPTRFYDVALSSRYFVSYLKLGLKLSFSMTSIQRQLSLNEIFFNTRKTSPNLIKVGKFPVKTKRIRYDVLVNLPSSSRIRQDYDYDLTHPSDRCCLQIFHPNINDAFGWSLVTICDSNDIYP